jgi:cyclin E
MKNCFCFKEIYPPRLSDFAYVTDNTCSEEDILDMELDLMNVRKRMF